MPLSEQSKLPDWVICRTPLASPMEIRQVVTSENDIRVVPTKVAWLPSPHWTFASLPSTVIFTAAGNALADEAVELLALLVVVDPPAEPDPLEEPDEGESRETAVPTEAPDDEVLLLEEEDPEDPPWLEVLLVEEPDAEVDFWVEEPWVDFLEVDFFWVRAGCCPSGSSGSLP